MKKNNHGHIVALSSIAGLAGLPNLVPYCASKFAVRGLMESLAEELNWNPYNAIKTTTVYPFMVDTGLCKRPYVRFEKALNLLNPKDVADKIMLAQRTGLLECTVPRFLFGINNVARSVLVLSTFFPLIHLTVVILMCIYIFRLLPLKAAIKVKSFFESGVHSDL